MQLIISPAKKMVTDQDNFTPNNEPLYLSQTEMILQELQKMSYDEVQHLWQTSQQLTAKHFEQLQNINLHHHLTPAIFSYSGIQYQYMAPDVLSQDALDYLQKVLRILSGFYGILRPFDGIVPHRLEMNAHLSINHTKNLYEFWGDRLYREINKQEPIINLASKEYSQAITPYLQSNDQFVEITFAHVIGDKLQVRATPAKIARGEMVRFIVENKLTTVAELKDFQSATYIFDSTYSTSQKLVFIHKE